MVRCCSSVIAASPVRGSHKEGTRILLTKSQFRRFHPAVGRKPTSSSFPDFSPPRANALAFLWRRRSKLGGISEGGSELDTRQRWQGSKKSEVWESCGDAITTNGTLNPKMRMARPKYPIDYGNYNSTLNPRQEGLDSSDADYSVPTLHVHPLGRRPSGGPVVCRGT